MPDSPEPPGLEASCTPSMDRSYRRLALVNWAVREERADCREGARAESIEEIMRSSDGRCKRYHFNSCLCKFYGGCSLIQGVKEGLKLLKITKKAVDIGLRDC